MSSAESGTSTLPARLAGIRVVEFGHVADGAFASMVLADLGADVVKAEGPAGDQMRSWPPVVESEDGERSATTSPRSTGTSAACSPTSRTRSTTLASRLCACPPM
jgi:hypothetical protein